MHSHPVQDRSFPNPPAGDGAGRGTRISRGNWPTQLILRLAGYQTASIALEKTYGTNMFRSGQFFVTACEAAAGDACPAPAPSECPDPTSIQPIRTGRARSSSGRSQTRGDGGCAPSAVGPEGALPQGFHLRRADFVPAGRRGFSAGGDEAFQFSQSLLTQFHGAKTLRFRKLGRRAEYHAQRDFRRPVPILERNPGVGMFRPVLAP